MFRNIKTIFECAFQFQKRYFFVNSAGKGFADLVFIPRANACGRPAIVIELKYNASADSAISQIKNRRYHGALSGYSNHILLVGINYSNTSHNEKKHTCIIESINNLD